MLSQSEIAHGRRWWAAARSSLEGLDGVLLIGPMPSQRKVKSQQAEFHLPAGSPGARRAPAGDVDDWNAAAVKARLVGGRRLSLTAAGRPPAKP